MYEEPESIDLLVRAYNEYHATEMERFARRLGQSRTMEPLLDRFLTYLNRPGKRLRPILLLMSYRAGAGRDAPLGPVLPAAFAIEAFHCFILIHDDVIDESPSRRGKASLHADLAHEFGYSRRRGESLAVVLGDLLYGFALEVLNETGVGDRKRNWAIRYFSQVIQDTGLGEALEQVLAETELSEVTQEEIERVYHLKTTRYTFEAPLVLGFGLSGADPEAMDPLLDYARPVGRAFQIANDLHEIHLVHNGTTDKAYDLVGKIRTLYIRRLLEGLESLEAAEFAQSLLVAQAEIGSVLRVIRSDTGRRVFEELREEIRNGFVIGSRVVEEAIREEKLPRAFLAISQLVAHRFAHSEASEVFDDEPLTPAAAE